MTSRFARLCSAGFVLTACSSAFAQAPGGPLPQNPPASPSQRPTPPAAAPAPTPAPALDAAATRPQTGPQASATDDEPVVLKLPDADIDTVLSALEIYTGKIILRPSQLPTAAGGYNLKITKPIPKSQAVLYLETILAMNNIAVIPMGTDALKIVQLPSARVEAPELIQGSTLDMPPSSKVASKLFQFEFLRAQEFLQMLGTMTNPIFGQSVPLVTANAVLITDSISNLQRIELLVKQVDKPGGGGMSTKFYQLRNGAKASDVVAKLRGILGTLQQQLGSVTTYSADDRTNQVILITDPRQFAFFDDLIEKLDTKADPNTRNDVIYLKHAKAADVVTVLTNIIRGQSQSAQKSQSTRPIQTPGVPTPTTPAPGAPATPQGPNIISATSAANPEGATSEFSSFVTVVNDERSNSVVVSGTLDDIRLMRELVDKLDNVLPQVRIEVVIAEVTLDDNHTSGISALGLKVQGDRLVGFSGTAAGIGLAGADGSGLASISPIGGPGSLGQSLDLAGLISLSTTPRKNNTTVLSVPTITTSHAKQAVFISSEKRPIVTGTTQVPIGTVATNNGFSTSQNVTQQDIGITLTVTPLIGGDGSVQLDVDADVQDVAGTIPVNGIDQPIISHRETKSTITANSGDIIVIGGMQRNKDSRNTNRLGPIPIIGDLFGSRTKLRQRTELIFFLRTNVLTNTAADNEAAIRRVEQLPDKDVPQKDEILRTVDPKYQPPPKKSVLDKILPH